MKKLTLLVLAGLMVLSASAQSLPWPATSPFPDSYGYTWKTSDDPTGPVYNWVDIITNGLGTELTGLSDDNSIGDIDMGLEFQYYWTGKNKVCIGSNGYISLANVCQTISSGADGFPPTPTSDAPNDVIAPFMADLTFASSTNPGTTPNPARLFYYSDVANNRFIVTYENVPFWVATTQDPNEYSGANTFQVILDASDSTITFQYFAMAGNWSTGYDGDPFPFVTGIENLTGSIGLLAPSQPINAASKPVGGTAITFYPPATPQLAITDFEVEAVQNDLRAGFFVPWPQTGGTNNYPLRALISNSGNTDVTQDVIVTGRVRDTTGISPQILWFAVDTVRGGLDQGESEEITFSLPFNPPKSGSFFYEVSIENSSSINDLNSINDARTAELVAVDTTVEVKFGYIRDDFVALLSQAEENVGLVNWQSNNDNSGGGIFIEPFSYPVSLTHVEMAIFGTNPNCVPTEGLITRIYGAEPNSNLPGDLLYEKKVPLADLNPAPNVWNRIPLDSALVIDSLGFFVSWIQDDDCVSLLTETGRLGPYSNRTYEIIADAWANYRSAGNNDFMIRVVADLSNATFTDIEEDLVYFEEFQLYPNPNQGQFRLEFAMERPADVEVKVLDLSGRQVYRNQLQKVSKWSGEINLAHLSAGMYLVQLATPQGVEVRRLVIE
jgi:hypothetical protein